ncbi:MAG: hypothetical protein HW414_1866, partial [Dehalococcoidia bacterium]|nr:hypothetical protein [Dehalococcoidia bacterium]
MKTTGWRWIGAGVVLVGLIATAIFWGRGHDEGWSSFLQGDPKRGGRLFFDRGCAHCHSVFGHGGKVASDLGWRALKEHMSFAQLVGVMWNHGPTMWQKMRDSGAPLPSLAEREMGDIFAYLYVLGYMEEGGDAEKGLRVWASRGCASCHTVGGGGEAVGPDLSRLEVPADAIAWAQRMWNHALAMEKAATDKGIPWPEFQDGEMADLLVFVRSRNAGSTHNLGLMPANPAAGRDLFRDKGCISCHAMRGKGGNSAPDLGRAKEPPRSVVSMVELMWNHVPKMSKAIREQEMEWPQLSEREMADLITYLYSVRYFDEPGDASAGVSVFAEKQCSLCHSLAGEQKEGPDLRLLEGRFSPAQMAYAMWKHGPQMYDKMKSRGISWSSFE